MKLAIAAALVGSAAAFAPAQTSKSATALNVDFVPDSEALPYGLKPTTLDGSMVGDVGFDPIGFSTAPLEDLFPFAPGTMDSLGWMREAELTHGRIAQLAVLGFIWPAAFGTFPGNDWTGVDAYGEVNPLSALGTVPGLALGQIVAAMTWVEFKRVSYILEDGPNRLPGDLRFARPGGYNPFDLDYSPEEFEEKQLQELKHCRLAMMGAIGLLLQNANSGTDVISQLGVAFTVPEYYGKAGYFLPEGI